MSFEPTENFVSMNRVSNRFVVNQQPQLETRNGHHGTKSNFLLHIIAIFSMKRCRFLKSSPIAGMVIPIKDRKDLFKGTGPNSLM